MNPNLNTSPADQHARMAEMEAELAQLRRELSKQKALAEWGERLSLLCEATGVGVWDADLRHGGARVSMAQLALYGLPPGSSLHFSEWLDRIHPEDRSSAEGTVRAAFEAGTPFIKEYRILRADTGEVRWIQSRGFKVPGIGDAAPAFAGFDMDVTDRKEAEEAQQEQLARLRATYESAPTGLCLVDCELRYLAVNERLAEMNAVPIREHLGRTLREVLPTLADALEPTYRRVLETGEPVPNIFCVGTVSARPLDERQWLVNCYPVHGTTGGVTGVSVAVLDVTDIRAAQERLSAALRAVEAADLAKARFIAAMNHEFRTPIGIIMGYAELLQQAAETGEAVKNISEHVTEIYTASQHLLQLVEDASRYASVSLKTYSPVRDWVAARQVITEAVRIAGRDLPRGVLSVELQPSLRDDVEIEANVAVLREGLASLLREVARRSPPASRNEIAWRIEEGTIAIEVHCAGLRLTGGALDQLRSPLDATDLYTRGLEGASFGVATADNAIRAHGGSMVIQSTPETGTRFVIELPLALPLGALSSSQKGL